MTSWFNKGSVTAFGEKRGNSRSVGPINVHNEFESARMFTNILAQKKVQNFI